MTLARGGGGHGWGYRVGTGTVLLETARNGEAQALLPGGSRECKARYERLE